MTDLGRNLKKTLDKALDQKDSVSEKAVEYSRRLEESLHEVEGFGVISTDMALLEEVMQFARENKLDLQDSNFVEIYNRTKRWHSLGIVNEDAHIYHAIFENLHTPGGIHSLNYTVDRLAFLINNAETLREYAKIGVPCNWYRLRDDVRKSILYWLRQGKLSKDLVIKAANAVAGTGYDAGLEELQE